MLTSQNHAREILALDNETKWCIVRQVGATAAESYAADELALFLEKTSGAEFNVIKPDLELPERSIIVGQGPPAEFFFPEIDFNNLDAEEIIIKTKPGRLLIAGGRPRGTLYAVYYFLQKYCDIRWWTPYADRIPTSRALIIPDIDIRMQPAFEYREPFWFDAFNGEWAARNFCNGHAARLTEKLGGKVDYKGFVHTFYSLVPPDKYFSEHPEWFSMINGKRTADRAQLCLSNLKLRDFVVERIKQWLRESPEAEIVSLSQNDWHGACQCEACLQIENREGTPAGPLLDFVNYVAAQIEPEFPDVTIDTLAYQYTRQAPKTIRPRENVVVRLCSIECNFAEPLNHPSNKDFVRDIKEWSKLTQRLYVWNYTTDFAHYIQPHPNWFVTAPNIRFFHLHGVKGLFEQGAYQSTGAEMAELRAWLQAQLMWNPYQDEGKLIDEFLEGYYGWNPARYIRKYMKLLSEATGDFYMTCYTSPDAPFLDFETLAEAEKLWNLAEQAAQGNPELLRRVRIGHLPVRYVWLSRWTQLRIDSIKKDMRWPLPHSRKEVADEWLEVATASGPNGRPPITHLNESGVSPQQFVERFKDDPPAPAISKKALKDPKPPTDLEIPNPDECVDAQEELARLYREGVLAEVVFDAEASDGAAVKMPGSHKEWAFQLMGSSLPSKAQSGKWQVYAVIKIRPNPNADPEQPAFNTGAYDTAERKTVQHLPVKIKDAQESYKSYHIGVIDMKPEIEFWVAPPGNKAIEDISIDRFYLIPARE